MKQMLTAIPSWFTEGLETEENRNDSFVIDYDSATT
jgi:hypothetical protein